MYKHVELSGEELFARFQAVQAEGQENHGPHRIEELTREMCHLIFESMQRADV